MTAELTADLEHTTISGVEVMEEYNRVHGSSGGAIAPFVFVSAMGLEHASPTGASSTSQRRTSRRRRRDRGSSMR